MKDMAYKRLFLLLFIILTEEVEKREMERKRLGKERTEGDGKWTQSFIGALVQEAGGETHVSKKAKRWLCHFLGPETSAPLPEGELGSYVI